MGLFKDFKEDFSQATKELMPGGEDVAADNLVVDTMSDKTDSKSELSKLDGLLEQIKEEPAATKPTTSAPQAPVQNTYTEDRRAMDAPVMDTNAAQPVVLDETSVITASTALTGNIVTAGSLDVQGTVTGNVTCNGKLVVTGVINGNSTASEFFADVAKVEGEVVSTGTVKIGAGSVIIGNITASSAVIAGAVKGDIDVQGPVVIDTSAVIMGNIKSRSVQINNGAIIEGFCSQCYAEIDIAGLFENR